MYGPKDDSTKFIPFVIEKMLKNEKQIDLTKGEQKRDFIYVEDVVRAYLTLVKTIDKLDKKYYHIEVGTGKPTTIKDIVLLIKMLTNSDIKLNFGTLPYRKNELMYSSANIDFIKKLGWEPKVSLEEGLKETISYYKRGYKYE